MNETLAKSPDKCSIRRQAMVLDPELVGALDMTGMNGSRAWWAGRQS